jgi:hypothetical protein
VTDTRSRRRTLPTAALAGGDVVAILVFALIGLKNHKEGITAAGLARNTLPILGVWFAIAPRVGTYERPGVRTLVTTWAIAVPAGIVIRALILHHTVLSKQISFGIVALVATLVLLLAWRGLAAALSRR